MAAGTVKPDLSRELARGGIVAGVDEAGRGPLAGPVVAAAVILDPVRIPDGIDDSKKLTEGRREALFDALFGCARIGVGEASPEEIDRFNILNATFLAMERAVASLPCAPDHILVDGNRCPKWRHRSEPIVGGDALSLSIAAASIVAKVTRDRLMRALAIEHPAYGWCRNKGYPTPDHLDAVARIGVTVHHRRSFGPVQLKLALG